MIEQGYFTARSGLRPMSAFVVLAVVLCGVLGRVAARAFEAAPPEPRTPVVEATAPLAFDIADRHGRVLAAFVDRYELHVSPRAMWQAHTPERMAFGIARVLGMEEQTPAILAAMLPDRVDGAIEAADWELSASTALELDAWVQARELDGLVGFRPSPEVDGAWRLVWRPVELLSREARGERSPWGWTRTLADGIARTLWGEIELEEPMAREEELFARRDAVWEALLPSTWSLVLRDVPCERLVALRDLLRDEGVHPHQLWFEPSRERLHPAGDSLLLGSWGWLDDEPSQPQAITGLEKMCDELFARPELVALLGAPGSYAFETHVVARRGSRPYFQSSQAPAGDPVVALTLDLELQRRAGEILQEALDEHVAAIAMAIVIDLETLEVLALDSRERWDLGSFPPIHHQFTPGSTFKVLTMAAAVEQGVVQPDELIDVFNREWQLPGRRIREAEGQLRGEITATDCLAFSMNIGMAQIGRRVPADVFRGALVDLGYGRAPDTGLGREVPGMLTPLKNGTWKLDWTHTSVSFGHEVMTSLWQHTAGLAAVLRGGEHRPLRLVRLVEGPNGAWGAPVAPGHRVFSPATCDTVRAMMAKGASEGTGRHVYRPDVGMLTKTGTAEKVPTERCFHIVGEALEAAAAEGRTLTRDEWDALPKRGAHGGKSCYTSSMCMVGRRPGDDRELMVLVVVDEPTGTEKYGGKVAGPAALALLEAALELDPVEAEPVPAVAPDLPRSEDARPWEEDDR